MKKSLGRALTGKQFETMAGLSEKEKEEFLAKLFLPLGAWGTTAVPARATATTITQFTKKIKAKTVVSKETDSLSAKTVLSEKPHIKPEDVHIKKTGHNADTQSDVFQVKFLSSNNKEIQFDLEISKKRLEQNESSIEEMIKDVIESEGLDAKEAEEFAVFLREDEDLLLYAQKLALLSEENIPKTGKISLEELEKIAISQYPNRVFQHFVQNYSWHSNSKLNHIGTENVHIKKVGHNAHFTKYEVQFKTQKGKRISLKLNIHKKADDNMPNDNTVLLNIRDGEIDPRVLTAQQEIQLAIGQMPAEIFKGLKSIQFSKVRGTSSVRHEPPGMSMTGKKSSKYALHGLPSRLAVRLPINEAVVHAFMRLTKSTKSNMYLSVKSFDEIPFSTDSDLSSTLAHELGHVLQNTRYSIPTIPPPSKIASFGPVDNYREHIENLHNPKGWAEAVKKDDASVSEYGDIRLTEDFAEAMRVYIATDGGTKDPETMKKLAHRFEILDSLMKKSMTERESLFKKFKKAMEQKGVAFVTSSGVLTHLVMRDHVYIIPEKEEAP